MEINNHSDIKLTDNEQELKEFVDKRKELIIKLFDKQDLKYNIQNTSYQSYKWITSYKITSFLQQNLDINFGGMFSNPFIEIIFTFDNIEMYIKQKNSMTDINNISRIYCNEMCSENDTTQHINYFFKSVEKFIEFLNFNIIDDSIPNIISKHDMRKFKIKNILKR